MPSRANKAESLLRVSEVLEKLVGGYTRAEIIRWADTYTDWNVRPPAIDKYIQKAYALLEKHYNKQNIAHMAKSYQRLEGIFRYAYEDLPTGIDEDKDELILKKRDATLALKTVQEQNKLTRLYVDKEDNDLDKYNVPIQIILAPAPTKEKPEENLSPSERRKLRKRRRLERSKPPHIGEGVVPYGGSSEPLE